MTIYNWRSFNQRKKSPPKNITVFCWFAS